ncbi:hypothetical protein AB0I81_62190 [Nonomuraea sp. NPDC050404]
MLPTSDDATAVTVAGSDPGADTDGYEDIVEIHFRSEIGRLYRSFI